MKVLGYVRCSTDEQAASGHGLAAQQQRLLEACERRGWDLIEILGDEGQSGKTLDRPALTVALEQIASGRAEGLMVAKLDRLTRSVIDFALLLDWFERAGSTLVALDLDIDTSTPGGRLVANVFAAVAEWERGTIAQRTKDGLAVVRAQGRPVSRPAVSDRPELAKYVRGLRAKGLSLRQICERLDLEGVPTARGAASWQPSAVQSVLGYRRKPPRRRATELPEIRRGRA